MQTTTTPRDNQARWLYVFAAIAGLAFVGVAAHRNRPWLVVFGGLVASFCVWLVRVRKQWMARGDVLNDERQRSIEYEASRLAFRTTQVLLLAGAYVELWRGRGLSLTVLCVVANVVYVVAFTVVSGRRS